MIDLVVLGFIVWGIWEWKDRASHFPATEEGRRKALSIILRLMQDHGITPAQITQAQADPGAAAPPARKRETGEIAMKVFSYLGAIFILGGIGAYVSMFWATMPSGLRIFITLGFGIALSALSCIAMKEGRYPRIVLPLIVIAAIVETGGWFVFMDETFPHFNNVRKAEILVFGIMMLQQWLTFGFFRRTSLFFFVVFFSYGFLERSLGELGMREEFVWMMLGGSLLCVSEWTKKTQHEMIAGVGFFFAGLWFNAGLFEYVGTITRWEEGAVAAGLSLCALGYGLGLAGADRLSAFDLLVGSAVFFGGLFEWVSHTPYELLYLAVAIAMMYGHTLLESRAVLFTSSLAILGFIGYYTSEHFVDSVGWPIALILLGTAFFGVGVMAVRIRRRASSK